MKAILSKFNPRRALSLILLPAITLAACEDSVTRRDSYLLDQEIVKSSREQLRSLSAEGPVVELTQPGTQSLTDITDDRLIELDEVSGPKSYANIPITPGIALDGNDSKSITLSLQQIVELTVRNNLDIHLAQLVPAVSQAQIQQAEAVFDAVFITSLSLNQADQPQQSVGLVGSLAGTPTRVNETYDFNIGIRKQMETGGQATISTGFTRPNNKTPGLEATPDPAWLPNITLGLQQPLLRNFGSRVNRAQIHLTRNVHRRDVLNLQLQLLGTIGSVEQAYWQLVLLRNQLAIQEKLLRLTEETRKKIIDRGPFDTRKVQIAQVDASVEQRRVEVINTRNALRAASDQIKQLLNSPQLPLSSETLIVPADTPSELPVKYNLLDSLTTALKHRPEIRQALLDIDDASIRTLVADNQRLPLLNLNSQMVYRGLDDSFEGGYSHTLEGNFIDYVVGLSLEAPIGNRAAESALKQARTVQQANLVRYQQQVRDVAFSVKNALRQLVSTYDLIKVNRTARRAAADRLRQIKVREENAAIEGLSADFLLDQKLSAQQQLAEAEIREVQAIANYNIALANFYQTQGTLLQYSRIQIDWPETMGAE